MVQVCIILNLALREKLLPLGYLLASIAPKLWREKTNSITFTLVVKNFGIKYQRKEYAQHFINFLQEKYEVI